MDPCISEHSSSIIHLINPLFLDIKIVSNFSLLEMMTNQALNFCYPVCVLITGHSGPVLNTQLPLARLNPSSEAGNLSILDPADGCQESLGPLLILSLPPPSASTSQRDEPILCQAEHRRLETDTASAPLECTGAKKNLQSAMKAIASSPGSFENAFRSSYVTYFPLRN